MRPRHQTVRDQLPALLRRQPGARSVDLAALAQTSPATMVRALKEAAPDILRIGKAGRTRYYLRRALRGQLEPIPVYRIDRMGQASQVGQLQLLAPDGCYLDVHALGWPVADEFANGVWPGLPYPLQDMWPQGFLGRGFARHIAAEFGVSDNPRAWNDDDALRVLSQRGSDCTGDLIVGEPALQRWLQAKVQGVQCIEASMVGAHYVQMADQATALGLAGSSAAGEFPKFTALRDCPGSATPHVIVKFSGVADTNTSSNANAHGASSAVQRWSDLLVCEHLALQAIQTLEGVEAARSRLLQSGGRTFLEVERFDRHGLWGRSALCSLAALEASVLSTSSDNWVLLAQEMVARGWLAAPAIQQMTLITLFGTLIHNTDMHKGNMSVVPEPVVCLAPVYDMLPMAYVPLAGGELPAVVFAPQLPMPALRAPWLLACVAAVAFWDRAGMDPRISTGFQKICQTNAQTLRHLVRL